MKRIGIITIIGNNYGTVLQNYALQRTFRGEGTKPHLISVRPRSYVLKFFRDYLKPEHTSLIRLNKLYSDIRNYKKRQKIKAFYKEHIITNHYHKLSEVRIGESATNAFVCGSDQIWNPAYQPHNLYYLSFVDNDKQKYSYAASIAVDIMSEKAKEYFKTALSSFSMVSVREKTGLELLKSCISNAKLRVDCDPVLLLTKHEWVKLVSDRYKYGGFLFFYMLRPSVELLEKAKKISEEKKLKFIFIGDYFFGHRGITQVTDASVQDFLSAIYYADYIITNSFHATVFATIFEKPFLSQVIDRTGSRVNDYLKMVGLESRIIDIKNPVSISISEVDYSKVETILNKMRNRSRAYISEIVRNIEE